MLEDITLKDCIEFAVKTEENGAKFYSKAAEKFSGDQEISELFSQLAKDEGVHRKQFSDLLRRTPDEPQKSRTPERTDYLKAMSMSEFFSPRHGPLAHMDQIKDRDDALKAAFELEKATLGFYKAVEDVIGSNPVLSEVVEAEKLHLSNVMKALLVEGSRFRSLQDTWS